MEDRDVYYNYLEELRKSGVTNMFGATPYLEAEFDELSHSEAVEILKDWMKNYSELSKRLGWDRSMTPGEGESEEDVAIPDDEDYYNLFHEDISKEIINAFLKQLAEEDKMGLLNNADHVWFVEGLPFIVKFKDGKVNFLNQADEISVYDDIYDWCSDFAYDPQEAVQKIKEIADVDLERKAPEPEADDEEVIEYGDEKVIDDDFDEGE